jgi:hypothetical protein
LASFWRLQKLLLMVTENCEFLDFVLETLDSPPHLSIISSSLFY